MNDFQLYETLAKQYTSLVPCQVEGLVVVWLYEKIQWDEISKNFTYSDIEEAIREVTASLDLEHQPRTESILTSLFHHFIESLSGSYERYALTEYAKKFVRRVVRGLNSFFRDRKISGKYAFFVNFTKSKDIEKDMESGDLQELRDQIVTYEATVRGVSQMFFKNDKYLLKSEALTNAVKQLLNIKELADDRDQQHRYVLDCHSPKRIVLCENIDFLRRPTIPRKHHIELWYAGGKNIAKLDYVDTRGLPIYDSGDWDYDGLKIFEAVKRKMPEIITLFPNGTPKSINETEHNSLWRYNDRLSGFHQNLFNEKEQQLIASLIKNNEWIMEESNDILKMIRDATQTAERKL